MVWNARDTHINQVFLSLNSIRVKSLSHGQLVPNGLSFFQRFEVVIQEVDVESCLKHCCDGLGPAEEVFILVAVDPTNWRFVNVRTCSILLTN